MIEFWQAVMHPDNAFLRTALLTGVLVSIACGVVGAYVVSRRITVIAGSISHCVLGGMGAARYLQVVHGWEWLTPLVGAVIAALISAALIGWASLRAKDREDTVISAVWAIGMAVGILFISRTPTYGEDLMSYLFGNILLVRPQDLGLIAALDIVVVGLGLLLFHQLQAVCFDEEFARLRGVPVELLYILLLGLTALTVVLLITVVGAVLVIALLTLPVAIAGTFAGSLRQIMIASALLSAALCSLGLAVSYAPDLPAGGTTIVLTGVAYIVAISLRQLLRRRPVAAIPG